MNLTKAQVEKFLTTLMTYYDQQGRHDLPWRQTSDPYHIVVSELMLQQTQVSRVIPKYQAFLAQFPDVNALASARLGEVLIAWQGLGYNRRAHYLWRAAQQVQSGFGGQFPDTLEGLVGLPGIGKNTAGAVMAYAFNKPTIFVETNIRSVIIHHFFADHTDVTDKEILHILNQLLSAVEGKEQPEQKSHFLPGAMRKTGVPVKPVLRGDSTAGLSHYRIFYWAMMDYGTHLKQTAGNNISRSRHYVKQSPFHGSRRQVRGAIIRSLSSGSKSEIDLADSIPDDRLLSVLDDLVREGFITKRGAQFELA